MKKLALSKLYRLGSTFRVEGEVWFCWLWVFLFFGFFLGGCDLNTLSCYDMFLTFVPNSYNTL